MSNASAPITALRAQAYTIPTDKPEADGTSSWKETTLVTVEVDAGGRTGFGYTYADKSLLPLLRDKLADIVKGSDAFDPAKICASLHRTVRNLGREGLAATAISAVDAAVWDCKAKLLDLPLATLLGRARDAVRIYGSGGFTTYADEELRAQLGGWVDRDGCHAVKMKIGTDPERDPHRVRVAKAAIGDALLFVDANGGFSAKQALRFAHIFTEQAVRWFEEPVSSDDLTGLALVRREGPPGMDISAGEYGYTTDYYARMIGAGAVDCVQADASRCGGITGFLRIAAVCEANHIDLSGHCAPSLHLHAAAAAPRLRHLEWFHDHVRIEHMLFEGAPFPKGGDIKPDLGRPGLGIELRVSDASRFQVG